MTKIDQVTKVYYFKVPYSQTGSLQCFCGSSLSSGEARGKEHNSSADVTKISKLNLQIWITYIILYYFSIG